MSCSSSLPEVGDNQGCQIFSVVLFTSMLANFLVMALNIDLNCFADSAFAVRGRMWLYVLVQPISDRRNLCCLGGIVFTNLSVAVELKKANGRLIRCS